MTGQAEAHARVVDEVPGGEVVGAVDDEVVPAKGRRRRSPRRAGAGAHDDADVGVERGDRVARAVDLGTRRTCSYTGLQVEYVDDVVVDHADRPHPAAARCTVDGCAQFRPRRRARARSAAGWPSTLSPGSSRAAGTAGDLGER